jgi:hypothetical protein
LHDGELDIDLNIFVLRVMTVEINRTSLTIDLPQTQTSVLIDNSEKIYAYVRIMIEFL